MGIINSTSSETRSMKLNAYNKDLECDVNALASDCESLEDYNKSLEEAEYTLRQVEHALSVCENPDPDRKRYLQEEITEWSETVSNTKNKIYMLTVSFEEHLRAIGLKMKLVNNLKEQLDN